MPRVSPQHLAARRDQILVAAASCFSRNGFHKTSMQDIIREAELSAGAIYNYFSSKDEIIEAIAQERHAVEQEVLSALDQAEPAGDTLKNLARLFVDEMLTKEGRQARKVGVLAWAEALLNPDIAKSMREGVNIPRNAIVRLVRQAQTNGEIEKKLSPDAIARTIIAIFHGFVLQKLWDNKTPHEEMLAVFNAFIDSISTAKRQKARPPKTPRLVRS